MLFGVWLVDDKNNFNQMKCLLRADENTPEFLHLLAKNHVEMLTKKHIVWTLTTGHHCGQHSRQASPSLNSQVVAAWTALC